VIPLVIYHCRSTSYFEKFKASLNNELITIFDDVVLKYNLPSNKIELRHFHELINIRENSELLLTPKLNINDIKCNNFNKMRVNKTRQLPFKSNKLEFISTWFERNCL